MKGVRLLSCQLILTLGLGLSGCASYDLERVSARKSLKALQESIPSATDLRQQSIVELLALGAKASRKSPASAVDHYLAAAEQSYRGATGNGVEARYYRHATGQAVALLGRLAWESGVARTARYRISEAQGSELLKLSQFDSIQFADAIEIENIAVSEQDGVGAPMICFMGKTAARAESHPFLSEVGVTTAATALVDFPSPGHARIRLHNVRTSDRAVFQGESRTLAANFTATLVDSYTRRRTDLLGVLGMLRPANYFDKMGLYNTELLEPSKIPVIFTHGLGSSPATWISPHSALLGEKWFRDHFQGYAFYYPTGLPPIYPAAGLRNELFRLHRELKARGAGRNADRMVLIGHSMGGLVTSFQIRDFRGSVDELFVSPLRAVPWAPMSRQTMITMLESPPPSFAQRAVFVATPHRGSMIANNWLGRFGSAISKVPEQLLSLQLGEVTRSLTSFGRSLLLEADPLDGIARLQAGNPLLEFTLQQPIAHKIPYHSLMGDRGKGGGPNRGDDPERSDGIVPYWSSYLEGAASEKIVPSHHSVHLHADAHRELKRILRMHLER